MATPMEQITAQTIAQLKRGEAPWQKSAFQHPPLNPESGTVYRGINRVMLAAQGHSDPRWMTFEQAEKAGYQVRKGSKSQKIGVWQYEKDGQKLERPVLRYFSVFHASQLQQREDGRDIPPYEATAKEAPLDRKELDRRLEAYRAENAKAPRGSAGHAMEELRVRMASWMISREFNLPFKPGSSKHFPNEWIKALEADKMELSRAARDAEKIKEYVLGNKQEQSAEQAVAPEAAPAPRPATEKTFLAVPFKEKDEARELGARWDGEAKLWYVPEGTDLANLEKWLPKNEPAPANTMSPEEEFAQALAQAGFKLNGPPIMNGEIHRVAVEGGKAGARDGAYCAHADGVPNGWAKNHKSGELLKWICSGHSLSDEQRAALLAEVGKRREERERKLAESRQKAADRYLDKLFSNTVKDASDDHPYLKAKGVRVYGGLKEDEQGNLLLAGLGLEKCNFLGIAKPWLVEKRPKSPDELMATRYLQTLQTISPDGQKRFEPGSQKTGAAFIIGDSHLKRMAFDQWEAKRKPQPLLDLGKIPSEILVAEGYATGATLYKASGKPVAVAFDAGNLKAVALALKKHFPGADITICADNDHSLKTNVGVEKAHDAAQAVGGRVLIPEFTEEEKARSLTDFNDLAQSRGLFTVTKILTTRPGLGLANAADEQSAAPSLSL